ncbi:putative addiction module antidote protein [Pseudomonas sp. TE3610]
MTETFTDYDPATYLTSPATIAEFMSDALETGDSAYVAKALGVVARAKGMTELADRQGYHANSCTAPSAAWQPHVENIADGDESAGCRSGSTCPSSSLSCIKDEDTMAPFRHGA